MKPSPRFSKQVKDKDIEKRGLLSPDEFKEIVDGVPAVRDYFSLYLVYTGRNKSKRTGCS